VFLFVVVGTDRNCNFSVMRSQIELKLGGDLGLVSQISVHVLVLRLDCFSYKKKNKNAEIVKNANPSLIDLKLSGDICTSSRNGVICLFCLNYCLFTFHQINR
jgi:hypothetical protein